jgi:DNA-binding NarL/FixJ family response regulator
MREGLQQLFALTRDIVVVAKAANGADTLERLRHTHVDLILLDMNMPGLSGDDLIARIHAEYPALAILVLSMYEEPQIARRALRAGASGYVAKDRDSDTILAAVRQVAHGGRYLDPVLAEQMASW